LREDRPIQVAGAADHGDLVRTLSQAFQSDPAVSWILPDPARRALRLPGMFDLLVRSDFSAGMALRSPGNEVATLWRAPGKAESTTWEMLRIAIPLLATFGTAIGRALAVADAIDRHHPKGLEYWYLHYAGVRPEHQGKGWGGQAIRAGISRAEMEGMPVYLETATPANVGLYQSLGFQVIDEWDVRSGGPHFWSMLRPATLS
jgi:ribosomal protein S18 acetylase RimI-like enzyme